MRDGRGGRTTMQKQMLYNLMFALMRKNNFDQCTCVKQFLIICRKKNINMTRSAAYKWYDRVGAKTEVTASFQQNINQFFTDLTRVATVATKNYLRKADSADSSYALDEYLRVANLQKEALNLQQTKSGDNNSLFMQFVQQNVQNNSEVDVGSVLASIQEGLGSFGPLIQRFTDSPKDSGGRTIPAICTKPETGDPD